MSAMILEAVDTAAAELVELVGVTKACEAVGMARASHYRSRTVDHPAGGQDAGIAPEGPTSEGLRRPQIQPRALSEAERVAVLATLHCERFADTAPATVYATLLDEGTYLCSESTMYRLLRQRAEVRERRRQATHPATVKPELVATKPNECWSWDITKLRGPVKWTWFYLYVILDIFSRYPVGWMVASRESDVLAERLIAESVRKQHVARGQLTLHVDCGSSMASKTVALLLADLGVTKSHSRPHVSNDNPFSEAQFKTLKYRPDVPDRFGCIEAARVLCSATTSSVGMPTNIAIPGSACTHRPTSTTAERTRSGKPAATSSTPLTKPPRNGSSASRRYRRSCPRPSGSTNPTARRNWLSNSHKHVSQEG